ncbi:MAG: hypothetical protein IKT56_03345 [Clostridia bacterium]|nr:hypothetical protein [Clostridia bacterium]
MIFPSITDLTKNNYNRYELVIATAKCARMITDEYVKERETAEKMIAANKESERAIFSMIKREFRDEKAVKCAINRLYTGDFVILSPEEAEIKRAERAELAKLNAASETADDAFDFVDSEEAEDADDFEEASEEFENE